MRQDDTIHLSHLYSVKKFLLMVGKKYCSYILKIVFFFMLYNSSTFRAVTPSSLRPSLAFQKRRNREDRGKLTKMIPSTLSSNQTLTSCSSRRSPGLTRTRKMNTLTTRIQVKCGINVRRKVENRSQQRCSRE